MNEIKFPSLPAWSKMDYLDCLLPSEIRAELKEYARATVALDAPAHTQLKRVPITKERALKVACDDYSNARAYILNSVLLRELFEAGFDHGWNASRSCIPNELTKNEFKHGSYEYSWRETFMEGWNECRDRMLENVAGNSEQSIDVSDAATAGTEIVSQTALSEGPVKPVARLHITSTDTYPDIEVEVLDGSTLQPEMSPVNVYTVPPAIRTVPSGTNLFHAGQVKKMLEYVLDTTTQTQPVGTRPRLEREDFEVWACDQGFPLQRDFHGEDYQDERTQTAWEGWRVRAARGPQPSADFHYRAAYEEWSDKTEFIQTWLNTGKLPAKYLGWHRADIMHDLIEQAGSDLQSVAAVTFVKELALGVYRPDEIEVRATEIARMARVAPPPAQKEE